MPASLPGATLAQNQANPTQGAAVIFDPLSGPKASPLDARTITGYTASVTGAQGTPIYANDPLNCSTGGLSTGIGFGSPPIFGANDPAPFADGNFTDDYIPGQDLPSSTQAADASIMYIGGGLSNALGVSTPRLIGTVGLCMAGNGGSRDGGTTPFTGFPVKTVTATGTVANGAAVETGWTNRSGVSIGAGASVFGSGTTPLADVA
jgi:hypothetical protein